MKINRKKHQKLFKKFYHDLSEYNFFPFHDFVFLSALKIEFFYDARETSISSCFEIKGNKFNKEIFVKNIHCLLSSFIVQTVSVIELS